jgi:formylglycine-generating enzyme required for sulfatase activity
MDREVYLIGTALFWPGRVPANSTSHDLLPELTLIPAGRFHMGSEAGEPDQRPVREVHVDEFLTRFVCPV